MYPTQPPAPPPDNNEGRQVHRTLSQIDFYRACETLKKHKARFLEERPNLKDGALLLSELSKTTVSEHAMRSVQEATGITWKAKYAPPSARRSKGLAIRTLTTAVYRLYKKLQEEAPGTLVDLYEDETGRRPAGEKPRQEQTDEDTDD